MGLNRITVFGLVVVGFALSLRQQAFGQDMPKIIPPSPNAAALGKYGDIPVSLYSGTADITVPLYEIKSGDIAVPITLSYHTGGIRLNELAGWTGLGFAFNAGGVISRSVMGADDLLTIGSNTGPEIKSKGSLTRGTKVFMGDVPSTLVIQSSKGEEFDFSNVFGSMDGYDFEYDIFTYNFLGRSGKFIVNHAGQPVLEKDEDIQIELFPEAGYKRFKITDERGFVYYFKAIEMITIEQPISTPAVSWYLTRIESPKGYSVDFAYNAGSSPRVGQIQESSTIACMSSPSATIERTASSMSYANALVLDSITFEHGSVDVLLDNVREDYTGQKITGIKVRSKASGRVIKEVSFAYDYFLKNITSNPGAQYKRLKLVSVTETAGGIAIPPYRFSYYEPESVGQGEFMYVGSNSVDHWGYYNGIVNTWLLPKFSGNIDVGNGNTFATLPGANRIADYNSKARAFSLKEIVYPTGGRTTLELETNTYEYSYNDVVEEPEPEYITADTILRWDDPGTISGSINLTRAEGAIDVSIGFMPTSAENWQAVKLIGEEKIWVQIGSFRRDVTGDFVNQQCPDNVSVCTLTTQLSGPGIYDYAGHIASDPNIEALFSMISVRLSWTQKKFQQGSNDNKRGYGGGLRVSSMTTYDENGNRIGVKSYSYDYYKDSNGDQINEQHSYGRRISYPVYTSYNVVSSIVGTGGVEFCKTFSRYSNSVMPLTTSVGYDQVVETLIDYSLRNRSTRTVHIFENKPDSAYQYAVAPGLLDGLPNGVDDMHPFGIQNISYKTNGLLKSRIDYVFVNDDYQPLQETHNYWTSSILMNYYSLKQQSFDGGGGGTRIVTAYPAVRSERVVLARTVNILRDLQNNTAMTTEDLFEYGRKHVQQVKHTRQESTGRTVSEYKIYPPDYENLTATTGGVKLLQEKHIIGNPVEEYTVARETPSAPDKVLKGTLTTYKTDKPVPDVVYSLEATPTPPLSQFMLSNSVQGTFSKDTRYKPRLNFVAYTDRGNIKQVAKTNDAAVAYLWAYNESYPIAEVKNCSADKFVYQGFEQETANVSPNARTGTKSYTSTYTVVLPAAGTYTLTYWKKTGTGSWKLVSVSNVTSNQVIGGSGALIDEVRLFPVGASMSTYTYDPLVGVTSMTDANNVTIYYDYDSLQRLWLVKDQAGNIVKRYTYNYFLK